MSTDAYPKVLWLKNVTPEDPDFHWNDWSAPKEAGGRKASKHSLTFKKKNGATEPIHVMDTTENRSSFTKLSASTAPGTFVSGDDYTVSIIAHYDKEDGSFDGSSEPAEFNVSFPAPKPADATNPAPANSGTAAVVPPPPPCAPQSEVGEIVNKLKGIEQTLSKATLDQADKDTVTAALQSVRDKADSFVILYPGTDVAPFRDEADRLENAMLNKSSAVAANPPANQPAGTATATAATATNAASNQPAANQSQTQSAATATTAAAAQNQPAAGTTANQPAANQPAAGTATANQPAATTQTATATAQANWLKRKWRKIVIGVGIAIITSLIGWGAKWYFVDRKAAPAVGSVNPDISKLQSEIGSKANELAEVQQKIAELKIAKLNEELAKIKAALEEQRSAATNKNEAQNSVANNEVKIRDIKDTKGNLLLQSQVNIYHAANEPVRDSLFESSDDRAVGGLVPGRTNVVVFRLTPEEIASSNPKFCSRKTLGPGDYGLIIPPPGGWGVDCWRSLDEKDIITIHNDRPARNITPGRRPGPVERDVRETRIYPKPGHPYCEVEVVFERPAS